MKDGHDKPLTPADCEECHCFRGDFTAARSSDLFCAVRRQLRGPELAVWAEAAQHLHRALVCGDSVVLSDRQKPYSPDLNGEQNEPDEKAGVKDFIEAAKWTLSPAAPHQAAAWNMAWGCLTKAQQEEFYEIFRADPAPKDSYAYVEALDLIKEFEGFEEKAYPDPITGGAPFTLGWGATVWEDNAKVKPGDKITKAEADDLLSKTVEQEIVITLAKTVPHWHRLSNNRKSALISFAYNVGWHFVFQPGFETISTALEAQDYDAVPRILDLYVNPGTAAEKGLRRRRKAEGDLWGRPYDEVLLKVPYESQHDNGPEGYRECLSSSIGMIARYHRKVANDNEYCELREEFGDTVQIQPHLEALRALGLNPRFQSASSPKMIKAELRSGNPVALGWLHKGNYEKPFGFGHWTVCVGFSTKENCYIMHDPNGKANIIDGGYLGPSGGAYVKYTANNFEPRWMPDGPSTGWMITVRR